MRCWYVLSALMTSMAVAVALPATNQVPAAIVQAAGSITNESGSVSTSSSQDFSAFDLKFQVPDTDTVLWVAEGSKVDRTPLQILLRRTQLELNQLIATKGPKAVPGRNPDAPRYSFLTRTPMGTEGFFYVSALSRGSLNYQLVNETLAGLKILLIEQGRSEQVAFEVQGPEHMQAFGGLSVGPLASTLEAWSNDTFLATDPASLVGITAIDVRLQCTTGRQLHPAIVAYLLADAQEEVQEKIKSEGIKGLLPGVAGEWEKDGHRGAVVRIDGIAPAHITWQIAQGAVAGLRKILVGDGVVPRELTCMMVVGHDTVGVASVKQKYLSTG